MWLPKQQYLIAQETKSQPSAAYNKEEALINLKFPAGRIVVIESHEETATLICEILTAAGFQVVWLLEASTAMKQIEILQPLIVIVDWQLSGTNGKEIVEQIRNLPGMQDIKILALTNKISSKNLEVETENYLLKPILPQSLLQKIQQLMANNTDE